MPKVEIFYVFPTENQFSVECNPKAGVYDFSFHSTANGSKLPNTAAEHFDTNCQIIV